MQIHRTKVRRMILTIQDRAWLRGPPDLLNHPLQFARHFRVLLQQLLQLADPAGVVAAERDVAVEPREKLVRAQLVVDPAVEFVQELLEFDVQARPVADRLRAGGEEVGPSEQVGEVSGQVGGDVLRFGGGGFVAAAAVAAAALVTSRCSVPVAWRWLDSGS